MTEKKFAAWLLSTLSALVLITVIFLTTIEVKVFDLEFFKQEYQKLNSVQKIGMSEQDLMSTTVVLLDYIKGEREDLSLRAEIKGRERQVFNQREITHMADVRMLYAVSHQVRNVGTGLLLSLLLLVRLLSGREYFRYWAKGYLVGLGILTGLLVFLGIAITSNFRLFWDNLHLLIFNNDLWMLNPETDILIQMVPEQFFYDLVIAILLLFVIAVSFLGVIAGIILQKTRRKAQISD